MSRVTSKLQVTIPKTIADRYGIRPGNEIDWLPAGEAIRVVPHAHTKQASGGARRLALFDKATERQRSRDLQNPRREADDRDWKREELYERGVPG